MKTRVGTRRVAAMCLAVLAVVAAAAPSAGQITNETITVTDRTAGTILTVNIDPVSPIGRRFVFGIVGTGAYWAADPITVDEEADGSLTVTYAGSGRFDPGADVDFVFGSVNRSGNESAAQIALEASISADRTSASAELTVGSQVYELADVAPPSSAAGVADALATTIESADWAGQYALYTDAFRNAVTAQEFIATSEDAFGAFGAVSDAHVIAGPTVAHTDLGWDAASFQLSVTFLHSGRTTTYKPHATLVFENGQWRIFSVDPLVADNAPPESSAWVDYADYGSAPIYVAYNASDGEGSGVDVVELWWRHRPYGLPDWGSWILAGSTENAGRFEFNFADGAGFYEFQTIATDKVGNREEPPSQADTTTEAALVPRTTRRASVKADGTEADGHSETPAISADGQFIAFASSAANLVPGDTNGQADVFVQDRMSGELTRVSASSTGDEANGPSGEPSMSGNGRYVAFSSSASDLVPGDTNGVRDVFVHDRVTGETRRVSVDGSGLQGDGASSEPALTQDASAVVFTSTSTNLTTGDTNGFADVFFFDLAGSTTTLVTKDQSGGPTDGPSGAPDASDDGSHVVFDSAATDLVDTDTNGFRDVFVRDVPEGTTVRGSVGWDGAQPNGDSSAPAYSGDESWIAFESSATNLVQEDTNDAVDVFVRDVSGQYNLRASVGSWIPGPGNTQADGDSTHASISADGRYVAFQSTATNLVAADANDVSDVFVADLGRSQTTRWSVAVDGSQLNGGSALPSLSADGESVAYLSNATNAVAGDANGLADAFIRHPE